MNDLPPIPKLTPEEKAASMQRAKDFAEKMQRDREQQLKELARRTTTNDIIDLWEFWQDYSCTGVSGNFNDFVYWLREIKRDYGI